MKMEMGEIRGEEPPIVSTPPGSSAGSPNLAEREAQEAAAEMVNPFHRPSDLAERLAREAAEELSDRGFLMELRTDIAVEALLPLFQRAVRGEG